MRQSKAAYKLLLGYIEHNTNNKIQGPSVSRGSVINTVSRRYNSRVAKQALEAAKHNNDIIHNHNTDALMLYTEKSIEKRFEMEQEQEDPNKDLIGHLNRWMMNLKDI